MSGKLGIYGSSNGILENAGYVLHDSLKKNVPDAKVIPLVLPKSPFGQFSMNPSNPVQMNVVIYRDAKDPVAAIKFVDFMVKKENWMTLRFGLEGTHWKVGNNSCPEYIDRDKYAKEVSWTEDFVNFASRLQLGKCQEPEATMNPDKPIDKEFLEFVTAARKAYMDPTRPFPGVTHSEHMPQLPKELQVINNDLKKQLEDIQAKAIVNGPSYTVDTAVKDIKGAWDKGNGKQVEDFHAKWYRENKDKALLTKDMYDMATKFE
jgi:putative aldouronate transport system substrate-binding protein